MNYSAYYETRRSEERNKACIMPVSKYKTQVQMRRYVST
jgi:hypothetical protein